MALVGYSDSEGSDTEPTPNATGSRQPSSTTSKPTFQKVVNRSNPHKIKVSLPATSEGGEDDIANDAPPAKKPRTGAGAFSGFNSFLPAPKRTAPVAEVVSSSSKGGVGKGLGRGINLKTGAAPGFSREPMLEFDKGTEEDTTQDLEFYNELGEKVELVGAEGPVAKTADQTSLPLSGSKPAGKPTIFKPLSVARNKQKKQKKPVNSDVAISNALSESVEAVTSPAHVPPQPAPKARAKVSLFSMSNDDALRASSTTATYESTSHKDKLHPDTEDTAPTPTDPTYADSAPQAPTSASDSSTAHAQSLASLASSLPPSARRQLLGRNAKSTAATADAKILNFSPDAEYSYNEEYRQTADAAAMQHNPVRGVAPGKHSLQQLVNVAATQKEALEESFATGRRNKREGGAKYGW
ncbi:hypothetical protein EV356DRAFT_516350 [Viridothelium virens]|uniref:Mitotic checkpoint regulator, MAD2B-interacting-domain-containing protein n=1 Tax=Viridothelium virens TaxID=1048519 RepID=A0A6A6H610_VIRVR|nr:hypothetical protein EV356DRAFT_516350 [Viridothelium virens]